MWWLWSDLWCVTTSSVANSPIDIEVDEFWVTITSELPACGALLPVYGVRCKRSCNLRLLNVTNSSGIEILVSSTIEEHKGSEKSLLLSSSYFLMSTGFAGGSSADFFNPFNFGILEVGTLILNRYFWVSPHPFFFIFWEKVWNWNFFCTDFMFILFSSRSPWSTVGNVC